MIFVLVIEQCLLFRCPKIASWIDNSGQLRPSLLYPPHDLIEPRFRPRAIDIARQVFWVDGVRVRGDDDDESRALALHPSLLELLDEVDPGIQIRIGEPVQSANLVENVIIGLEKEPAFLADEHAGYGRHADGAASMNV